ncbi:retention module-containing protein [Vibrio sonorensis]|uniref:retention module-containing protein n=1 Tax=Vibrio sonorensis TaxID=1004316 RepID=UPI000A048625|nr:retention module-containing protein [Vibrio sonorensis]
MGADVIQQQTKVESVSGDVVVVDSNGAAHKAQPGETLSPGQILITVNQSNLTLTSGLNAFVQNPNCVSCVKPSGDLLGAQLNSELVLSQESPDEVAFGEDDIAALQEAILEGVDPTQALEAAAAGVGAGGSSSANAGFITIDYNFPEVLASTFFETSFQAQNSIETEDDDFRALVFADGGETSSQSITEDLLNNPDSVIATTSVTIFSGDLPLDPDSFEFTDASLSALLSELNSDITTNGNAVTFTYDSDTKTITGRSNGLEVMTISITATSLGSDVQVDFTTELLQPIDHLPSVGGGVVAISGDQITLSGQLTGSDIGSNSIQTPVNVQVSIIDGANSEIASVEESTLYEAGLTIGSGVGNQTVTANGEITFEQGSDEIVSLVIDVESFNNNSSLTSQGNDITLQVTDASQGKYTAFSIENGVRTDVFEATLTLNQSGTSFTGQYQITLLAPLDHDQGANNVDLQISLPILITDADGDQSQARDITVNITDDTQVLVGGALDVTEPDVGQTAFSNTINVISQAGADGAVVTQFTFDGTTYSVDGSQTSYGVTGGTLYINQAGEVYYQADPESDHPLNNLLSYDLVVTVVDGDDDPKAIPLTVNITDGNLPEINTIASTQVYESGITGGSQEGVTAVSANGVISLTTGSDEIIALKVNVSEFNTNNLLESGGERITLEDNGNGLYSGFIGSGASKQTVFTVELDQTDLNGYTVTLLKPLDHDQGANDATHSLVLPVYAEDKDGDKSAQMNLSVTVHDDEQVLVGGDLDVIEPDVGQTAFSNTINVISQAGADGAAVTQFTFDGTTYSVDGSQTSFAVTGGTLHINQAGEVYYQADPESNHPLNNLLSYDLVVTVVDGDDDPKTIPLTVNVTDGNLPEINTIASTQVYESGITGGSQEGVTAVSANGVISLTTGSDEIIALKVNVSEFNTNNFLESGGERITLEENGNGLYSGFIGSAASKQTVFTVELDQTDLNGYTVTLLKPLDHDQGANDATHSLVLPVYAEDKDGDKSAQMNLSVTVHDDEQVLVGGDLDVTEPDVGQTAFSNTINVISQAGADGAAVTQFTFDGTTQTVDGSQTSFAVTGGTLHINQAGQVYYQADPESDHPLNNLLSYDLVVTVVDGDDDPKTIPLTINITDGNLPEINTIASTQVYESGITGGSQEGVTAVSANGVISLTTGSDEIIALKVNVGEFNTNNLLESGGERITLEDNGNGLYSGFIGSGASKQTVFTVELDQTDLNGYTVTLLKPLDHDQGANDATHSLVLPVYAEDKDGDKSAQMNLSVTVHDDEQVLVGGDLDVTEPDVGQTAFSNTINVISQAGADGAAVTQFTFDGTTQTVDGSQTSFAVTGGTLHINQAGQVYYQADPESDHPLNNLLSYDLVVTVVDGDDDPKTIPLTVNVTDGNLPEINTIASTQVYESGITGGSQEGVTAVSANGVISLTTGSDEIIAPKVNVSEFNTNNLLESGGERITLEDNGNGLYSGFIGSGASKQTVFTVELDQTDLNSYTVTLLKPLDHGQGANDATHSLVLPVYAEDKDGDKSAQMNLSVTVHDDAPNSISVDLAASDVTVNESELSVGSDSTTVIAQARGEFDVSSGADLIGEFVIINGDTVASGLRSGGELITVTQQTGTSSTYLGKAGTETVFRLTLNQDGTYHFVLEQPLDHTPNLDELILGFEVAVVDSDGDQSLPTSLNIKVVDDGPEITLIAGERLVDEDDLSRGSDRVSSDDATISGTITLNEGADSVVRFQLEDPDAVLAGITSGNNKALSWAPVDISGEVTTYTAQMNNGRPVFTLTLDALNNTYEFELIRSLNHPLGWMRIAFSSCSMFRRWITTGMLVLRCRCLLPSLTMFLL